MSNSTELMETLFPYNYDHFSDLTTHVITELELQMNDTFVDNTKNTTMHTRNSRISDAKNYAAEQLDELKQSLDDLTKIDGSNSWVISGEHTKSGKPIHANDPHLANGIPTFWYLSHISYPDGSFVAGASFPGFPVFLSAQSDKLSVGVTNLYADNSDLYEERIVDDKYEFNGEYYPLDVKQEVIKVKGQPDRVLLIKSTRNGPLISEKAKMFSYISSSVLPINTNMVFSLKWTGFDDVALGAARLNSSAPEIYRSYSAFQDMHATMFAQSVEEAISILRGSTGI